MKKKDFTQIKGLDIKELKGKAKEAISEIAKLTMDKNMKKIKDLKEISKKKKDLAQILTVIRQKQLLEKLETKNINGEKETVMEDSEVQNKSKGGIRTESSK